MNPNLSQPTLRKSLTTFDGVALLIGITIGSGIYSTPYIIAGYFSSFGGVILTWLIVGAFVMVGGLIYAELGTRIPTTGGEYAYITKAFGPFAGFMFGWAQLFIIRTSPGAALAIISADYLGFFFPLEGWSHTVTALSVIALVGLFNYVGVQWAALFQRVTTVAKVAGLAAFALLFAALLGGTESKLAEVSQPMTDAGFLGNLIPALMLIVFTHAGWDRVGYVAGEMKNPRQVIPKSMLYGLGIVLVIYWAVITIYHYVLGMEALRATATPAADIASIMIGTVGAGAVAILAIVSAVSSINGTTMSASRVYYAMAHDGLFFKWFDHVHQRFRTPNRAILAHVVWASVILIARGSFENIAAGMVFAILIFYTMTTLALLKFRRDGVGEEQAFRMPGYPLLPVIYLCGLVGLLGFRAIFEWEKSLVDIAFVATGLPISWYWLRQRSLRNSPDTE
ncbi:MAG: APC family permease [Rhodothermales bacterium]|nr:APC family permease [Rhodothermales bacterium]